MAFEKLLFIGIAFICLHFSLGCEVQKENSPFSFQIDKHPGTGWQIVTLNYVDAEDTNLNTQVKIAPEVGNTLFSMQYQNHELLIQPEPMEKLKDHGQGVMLLYPTPNRVKDATLTFEDVTLTFPPNNRSNFIHGLARDAAWEFEEPIVTKDNVTLHTWLDFDTSQSFFSLFPYKHRLSLDFILNKEGVVFKYRVENKCDKRLPFGFALHPFFRVLSDKESIFVKVPAQKRMEAIDKIPTGKLLPMDVEPDVDLREFHSVASLNLDDVFWGLDEAHPAVIQYRNENIQLMFVASDDFTHGVLYTPPRDVFCFENQTCSTDAHNLYTKGFVDEAHLQILNPGESTGGQVFVKIGEVQE